MKEHISLLPSSRPPTHPSPHLFRTESNRFRRDSIRPTAKKKASITSFYPDLLYISPPRAPTPLDGNREARAPIYIKHLAPFKKTTVEGTGNAPFSLSLYGKYFIGRTGQRSGGGQKKRGGLGWVDVRTMRFNHSIDKKEEERGEYDLCAAVWSIVRRKVIGLLVGRR